MPKKNMGLKRKNLTGYMGGGVFKSKAPVSSSFRGGGATEVGTEKKVQSYSSLPFNWTHLLTNGIFA